MHICSSDSESDTIVHDSIVIATAATNPAPVLTIPAASKDPLVCRFLEVWVGSRALRLTVVTTKKL
eukprot:CAMPEP_0198110724 /NCGR_PEP_ID=MMETSP1442-20131203/2736_1 /TAXON_ID= /ORGANISM="Craspedostauros australis, Strain CCMP3328" /LENGTH=65 /DNA_ID=CAMNT_0043766897 /DNA_START=103 /DNA_END=297 /DNA_ORIENTATION=-